MRGKKNREWKRILAALLAVIMVTTLLPTSGLVSHASSTRQGKYGVVQTVDDPQTLTRPNDTFEAGVGIGSTLNAGKILVGKSVMDSFSDAGGGAVLDLTGELTNMPNGTTKTWTPAKDNFLVTISQSSQMYGVSSRIPVPLDVVFVIDTSGSMSESVGGGQDRADAVMAAANSAIKTLLEANDDNRVGVVAFSGSDGSDRSGSRSTTVLTSLGHYSTNGDHLAMKNGQLTGKSGSRNARSGGTNIQMGIAAGAKMLMSANNFTVTYGERTITRIPVLVILSDGAPTFSSSALDWTNPTGGENGRGSSDRGDDPGEGFLAMLTAAYYKNAITEKYYGSSATADQRTFVYTIGVGLGTINQNSSGYSAGTTATLANLTMNPSQWLGVSIGNNGNQIDDAINAAWTNYQNKNDFTIRVGRYNNSTKTYSFRYHATSTQAQYNIDPSVTSLKYNDKYWSADSRDEINSAFGEMVIEIQKRAITAPTLTNMTWGQDYSGFVTFTDPIGDYMEVKNVIGATGDGYLYQGIGLAKLAEGYNPDWESDSSTTTEQATFNAALEQAFLDRMTLSTAAGGAIPTIGQVRSILDVVTRTAAEGNVSYDVGGGNVQNFDYATYGGQFYYNSDRDYGNSFTWFGKIHYASGTTEAEQNADYRVQFVGVAPKNADQMEWLNSDGAATLLASAKAAGANCIVRSYFMYGTAGGNHDGEPTDMLHFQIRVITAMNEPHQQYVSIKAPASLLAMQKVLIDDTDPRNPEAHYTELVPSRVIYEVGLRSDINANNVLDIVEESYLTETLSDGKTLANVNADGTINFYTNDWDRSATIDSHERALAHANFEVSNNNSFYRYEVNTPLFNMDGSPLTTKPALSTQYKYERTYYTWTIESDGVSAATKHTDMITVISPSKQETLDAECGQNTTTGQWYIKAGVYSGATLTAGDDIGKSENTTGTASVVTHPVHSNISGNPKYTTWLGNNGKIVFVGLKMKSVIGDDMTTDGIETDAEIDGRAVKAGDVLTYKIQAVNSNDVSSTVVVTDTLPAGTALVGGSVTASVDGTPVSGADVVNGNQITWTLNNVAVNALVQVSFQVTVLNSAISNIITNQASVQIGTNNYTTNITSNPVVGKLVATPSDEPIPAEGLKVGDSVEYKIAYYNTTDEVATIVVKDIVPAGTVFAGATSHSAEMIVDTSTDPNGLSWTIQNVQPGTGGVVSFTVTIDASIEKILINGTDQLGVENSASYIIDPANGPDIEISTNPTEVKLDTGDLQLKKAVQGSGATTGTFTLVLTESTGKLAGIFETTTAGKTVTFANGMANVEIAKDETVTITGLPEGIIIVVTEANRAGYSPSFYLGDDSSAAVGNTVTISDTLGKVFVLNNYSATNTDDISTMFSLKKTLNSPVALSGKNFTFLAQAADATGTLLMGVAAETLTTNVTLMGNETKANITFSGKTFSAEGDYYYLVTEYHGALEGITYDEIEYLVKIHVTDNGEGKLVVNPGDVTVQSRTNASDPWANAAEIAFTNSYKPADVSITLTGTKNLTGRDLIAGEFTFIADETDNTDLLGSPRADRDVVRYGHHNANGEISFDPIFYSEEGLYTYQIKELQTTGQKFVEFDTTTKTIVVRVQADANGILSASIASGSDSIEFTNAYETQDVTVTPAGTKTLTNRADGHFSFGVYAWDAVNGVKKSNTAVSTGTVTISAANTATDITFSPISYSLSSFTTVPNGSDASETFVYVIEELVPTVGADTQITYDRSRYMFQVKLDYNSSTGELFAAVVPGSLTQIADRSGVNISLTVPGAAFTNLYTPPKDVVLNTVSEWPKVVKNVSANAGILPGGLTFGFQVIKAGGDDDGYAVGTVVGTAYSAATGGGSAAEEVAIAFTPITFSKPGTYQYWIVENNAGETLHGVVHSNARYLMIVTITMEADGTLTPVVAYYSGSGTDPANYTTLIPAMAGTKVSFENIYSANGTMSIVTKKILDNLAGSSRPLTAGMFGFTLMEEGGAGAVHNGTNAADGTVVFDTLTFTAFGGTTKTLTYIMQETPGVIPGISYDQSQYRITVELTESAGVIAGEITKIDKIKDTSGNAIAAVVYDKASGIGAVEDAVFTNQASVYDGAEIDISLSKVLNGRDMIAGEFGFTLTHTGTAVNGVAQSVTPAVVDTVLVNAKGNGVADDTMKFHRDYSTGIVPGTVITYEISELPGAKGGVTYDKTVYQVKVEVYDEGNDGDLEARIIQVVKIQNLDGSAANEVLTAADIDFVNTYKVATTTVTLEGTKTLTGRDVSAGEFVFEVRNSADEVVTTGTVDTGNADTALNIVFDPITYYEAGVYTYKVVEEKGNRASVSYSQAEFNVVVTVTEDQAAGTLTAVITSVEKVKDDSGNVVSRTDEIAFNNVYTPTKINIAPYLEINKVLTGRDMVANEFDFVVVDKSTETVVSYGDNGAANDGVDAKISFASFTVDAAGTYVYEITEGTVAAPKVIPDGKTITVTVIVSDDGTGKLSVDSITYANNEQTFNNEYVPTPVSQELIGTKYLTGMPLADQRFGFTATLEKKDGAGNWQTVTGVVITGKNAENGLIAFAPYAFTEKGEYRWTVTEDNRLWPDGFTLSGGTMNYDGTTYHVYVTVSDDGSTGTLSIGSVTYKKLGAGAVEEDAAAIVFNNVFTPTEQYKPVDAVLVPNGSKVLNGRDLIAGEFGFTIADIQGNTIATGTNDAAGNIVFDYGTGLTGIKFSAVGTYFYSITENAGSLPSVTYDPAQWGVRFDVTQDSISGELVVSDPVVIAVTGSTATDISKVVFTNSYDPVDAEVALVGYKELTGRQMNVGEFEFHLINGANNVVATGYNDANGVITFDKLVFSSVTTEPLALKIVEVDRGAGGVTYDTDEIAVRISVFDDVSAGRLVATVEIDGAAYDAGKTGNNAQVKFENIYVPQETSVTIEALKEITGKVLEADEFSFILTDASGTMVPGTTEVKNDINGDISFSVPIDAAGEYTWYISEVEENNPLITYDSATYAVVVKVVDDLNGLLVVESVEYQTTNGGIPVFENTYTPEKIQVNLTAEKLLAGKLLEDDQFTFLVKDTKGTLDPSDDVIVVNNGTNKADGSITIGVEFGQVGTYHYMIVEKDEGENGYTYDLTEHPVTIEVTALNSGVLVADVKYANGTSTSDIVINNLYDADDCEVTLTGFKNLTGGNKTLEAGAFEFVVTDVSTGDVVARGTNLATGEITFYGVVNGSTTTRGIQYSAEGIYSYLISEVPGNEPGMTYDSATYPVTVVVEDINGVLIPTVTYSNGTSTSDVVFNNTFAPVAVKVALEGRKVMMGRDLADDEFQFEVYDSNGNLVANGTNKNNGVITFDEITLHQEGTYTLTVNEIHNGRAFVFYDLEPRTVTIKVTNVNGVLTTEVQYPAEGLVFVNVYDEPYTPPVVPQEPAPDTGDHSTMILWGTLAGLSVLALGGVLFARKRRNDEAEEQ